MSTVNYTPDPNNKPQLTQEQKAQLDALSDENIDYSDIPELDDDFWQNAHIVTPDLTQPVTLRIKSSVLQYFQANGKKGYQSRINAVLESYVKTQQKLEQESSNS
ncbi:BrnA antitoxin family protein [Pleurocapsa sp. PCC 7319]|uniref:BrnA antitoxin family protein n=1 Tax=Pleurocapsa sp. PCC 7319 TaxID=118161 RepID=UPI00034D6A3A|nr:BrnA antitoxin family protein [Pleurocapsa sp. PCC 7319]